jgi:hypothetical protein
MTRDLPNGIWRQRGMARTQTNRARRDARGRHSGSHPTVRDRPVSAIQAVAPSLVVEVSPPAVIMTASGMATFHRDLIITLAAGTNRPQCLSTRLALAASLWA